jgi:hypothetical protein
MSDEHRSVWPWVIALLIGLPMLYIASFGPACWLADHKVVSAGGVFRVFRPLIWITARCPGRVSDAFIAYSEICKPDSNYVSTGRAMILYELFWPQVRLRKRSRPLSEIRPSPPTRNPA